MSDDTTIVEATWGGRSHPDIRLPGSIDQHNVMMRSLHVHAVSVYVAMPLELIEQAVLRLLRCHRHVFVVDHSYAHTGDIGLGVSTDGEKCLRDEFPDLLATA